MHTVSLVHTRHIYNASWLDLLRVYSGTLHRCRTFPIRFQAALEAQVKVEQESTTGLTGILSTIEGQGERRSLFDDEYLLVVDL